MKKIFHYTIICFFVLLLSCNSENSQEVHFLNDALLQETSLDNYKWLVIIPEVGCNGCIQEGEYFLKQHVDKNDICFVLTNIKSIKLLQQKIGVSLKNRPNVYIDRNNKFLLPTKNSVYPCVIKKNINRVKTISFQSPETAALRDLENEILNQ
ncbi:MAG: hypothetical protein IJL45_02235 [Prevotella sp.]|mgnify:CR=1 FL=1|nr:hypothetical protein [Prevotella sp.]